MKKLLFAALLIFMCRAPAQAQQDITGRLIAASSSCNTSATSSTPNCIVVSISVGSGGVGVTLGGTFSATAQFEGAGLDGVFHALAMVDKTSTSGTLATSSTSAGYWTANVSGIKQVRVRVSSYSSGTVVATISTGLPSAQNGGGGGGNVTGPGSSAANDVATYADTTGQLLLDGGGPLPATKANVAHQWFNSYTLSTGLFTSTQPSVSDLTSGALANGSTATTQSVSDNTTKVATDAFVLANAGSATPAWSTLSNPAGNLALSMGSNTSIFSTTTAVSQMFAWKNVTAALVGTSQSSPIPALCGTEWHSSASVEGCMTWQFIPGTGTDASSTIAIGHTGSATGAVMTTFPGPVQAGTSGGVAGGVVMPQGTAGGHATANQITVEAPASVTAYEVVLPGASATGFVLRTDTSGVDTESLISSSGTGNVVRVTSPTLVTPALGAATATSLLASGIVDGVAPVTNTTGTTATLGAGTYNSGYTFNQEATAGTGVTYTLPATVKGAQYCVANNIVSGTGAPNTGVLTVYPPASSYVILNGVINTIGGGGTHGVASGGAAADAACFVANDATHWTVYVQKGTWTAN